MAAILTDLLLSPCVGSPAAGFFRAPRSSRRGSFDLSEALTTIRRVACQGLLFLWMLAGAAFSLLLTAGAVGVLG